MDMMSRWVAAQEFLIKGGPAIWAIAALSVITMALILWKIWRLSWIGAWRRNRAEAALAQWEAQDIDGARALLARGNSMRVRVLRATSAAALDGTLDAQTRREEALRVAKNTLSEGRSGLRALELIANIAPLLGLLGTVLGMIEAFQTLQEAGSRADPAALAGGIWEALLTTAAGMAVAIPASAALTWFESVIDRVQGDMEDGITRILRPISNELPQSSAKSVIRDAAE